MTIAAGDLIYREQRELVALLGMPPHSSTFNLPRGCWLAAAAWPDRVAASPALGRVCRLLSSPHEQR